MKHLRQTDLGTVAVVENDDAARHSFAVLLKSGGYRVEAFADGLQFLAALGSLDPVCVLLEARLPMLDGLAVLERLNAGGAHPPVILMTRVPKLPAATLARELGALMLLEKPIGESRLFSAIKMAASVPWQPAGRVGRNTRT